MRWYIRAPADSAAVGMRPTAFRGSHVYLQMINHGQPVARVDVLPAYPIFGWVASPSQATLFDHGHDAAAMAMLLEDAEPSVVEVLV